MPACDWPVSYISCTDPATGQLPPVLAGLDPATVASLEEMATEYLWRWTGRSLGLCPVQLRPCRRDCWAGRSTFSGWVQNPLPYATTFTPALVGGQWLNIGCGRCGDACSCSASPALRLPGPIEEVVSVYVGTDQLAPSSYRIDNGYLLVRTDGQGWPTCQDMSATPGAPDTFVIDCVRGLPVPLGGQAAAGLLTVEFAKAFCNDASCQLPRRLQSITRQGVTVAILDAFDDITKGHTGIWMVDSWVASVTQPSQPSQVYSPDLPRPGYRVQTWPAV